MGGFASQSSCHPAPVFVPTDIGHIVVTGLFHQEKLSFLLRGFVDFDTHLEWHDTVPFTMGYGNRYFEKRHGFYRVEMNA